MSELPAPAAARLARPGWLDARLALGVLLVVVSMVVGVRVVAGADDSIAVWSVRHDVAPHTALTAGDLELRKVQISGGMAHYVRAGELPAGLVTIRRLTGGELLPVAAVVRGGLRDYREVALAVDPVTARGLDEHAVVDVYVVPGASASAAGGAAGAALAPLLRSVTVVAREDGGGSFGAGGNAAVTILVPSEQVARVVTATSQGSVQLVRIPPTAVAAE